MTEKQHIIEFGPKFCQAHFDRIFYDRVIVADTAAKTKTISINHWNESFSPEIGIVIFDLSLTEWVATEQITFLFAWIANIKAKGKKIKVRLPYRRSLSLLFDPHKLTELALKYQDAEGLLYADSEKRIERRTRSSAFLMIVYGMQSNLGLSQSDFEHLVDSTKYNKEWERLRKNDHQIIPFSKFDLSIKNEVKKLDSYFVELINSGLSSDTNGRRIFNLQEQLSNILKNNACYSPFESKILSNIITQELYINSLQHSFQDDALVSKECYITAFLNCKPDEKSTTRFIASFAEERYGEILDFYKDKEAIKRDMEKTLQTRKGQRVRPRLADLSSFKTHYALKSYLEYTFLDFGDGIANTLSRSFGTETGLEKIMSPGFKGSNKDSKVLEYSFLLNTSRNPLSNVIDHYDLVPRGLYFLIDMVRRYSGLLIAKSIKGMIVYDFSPRLYLINGPDGPAVETRTTHTIKTAVRHTPKNDNESFFPGTLVTIVLPEMPRRIGKPKDDAKVLSPVRADPLSEDRNEGLEVLNKYAYSLTRNDFDPTDPLFNRLKPHYYEYVPLLFLYNEVVDRLKAAKTKIKISDIYNILFERVNEELDKHIGKSAVIFFDFSGLRSGNPAWIKLLYFLMNCPKINELLKLVVTNLPSDEVKIIAQIKENLCEKDEAKLSNDQIKKRRLFEPHLFRPIPCIDLHVNAIEDKSIEWIGLRNSLDEELLTSLLLGKRDHYNVGQFKYPQNLEGSVIVRKSDDLFATFSDIKLIRQIYVSKQREYVIKQIKSHIKDGQNRASAEPKHVFLASNGGYLEQYLSLYEILHDKYVARFFAMCLLEKYLTSIKDKISEGKDIQDYTFTKIVTVTVSSQLLGVAIRDLIEQDNHYSFLRTGYSDSGQNQSPQLIMLSSYYSFDTEKPFEDINFDDKVLLVNDVISTGSLVANILKKLDDVKKVPVSAIFSIADTRIPNHLIHEALEQKSEFFNLKEKSFFTLAKYEDGLEIRKFKGPYKGTDKIKRINPLLNAIIELKAQHSEQNKILFPEPHNLINDSEIDPIYFKIGHFKQNLTHNGYMTDMRPLFGSAAGPYLLRKVKKELENRLTNGNITQTSLISRITHIDTEVFNLRELLNASEIESTDKSDFLLNEINEKLLIIKDKLRSTKVTPVATTFQPDFIFYPIFSGIERLSHLTISEIFNTHPDNIIGLQRFDTPKGWRFPFPAKRFNELTKHKAILILDTGSLTGESLVQLVDNIAFLDVSEISVLTIITRVEDFYREFYSRLRLLKVKTLKNIAEETETSNAVPESVIPINVFFGISLHIPSYSSAISCPFCKELDFLKSISPATHITVPLEITSFIKRRTSELEITDQRPRLNISYLPRLKNTNSVDVKTIYRARDMLGKIDSYRFYPEYFEDFETLFRILNSHNALDNSATKQQLESTLACLLHEPQLYELIKSLLPDLKTHLEKYIISIIKGECLPFYEWTKESIVRLYYIINSAIIYESGWSNHLNHLLSFCDDQALNFIHFKLWDSLYSKTGTPDLKTKIEKLIIEFENEPINSNDQQFIRFREKLIKVLTDFYKHQSLSDNEHYCVPFYNLKKFYLNGKHLQRHFHLKEKLNDVQILTSSKIPNINSIEILLQDIINLFDTEIKPNAEMISADSYIIKYHKIISVHLGATKPGALYYFDEFQKAKTELTQLTESNPSPPLLKHIKEIARDLATNVLNEQTPSTFFRICNSYPCDYIKALRDLRDSNSYINLIEPKETFDVQIHSDIFKSIINELITNAQTKYTTKVRVDISCESIDSGVKIQFVQNLPYIGSKEVGGLRNNVKYFIEKFKGSFKDNREQSERNQDKFIITINLLRHTYDIENKPARNS